MSRQVFRPTRGRKMNYSPGGDQRDDGGMAPNGNDGMNDDMNRNSSGGGPRLTSEQAKSLHMMSQMAKAQNSRGNQPMNDQNMGRNNQRIMKDNQQPSRNDHAQRIREENQRLLEQRQMNEQVRRNRDNSVGASRNQENHQDLDQMQDELDRKRQILEQRQMARQVRVSDQAGRGNDRPGRGGNDQGRVGDDNRSHSPEQQRPSGGGGPRGNRGRGNFSNDRKDKALGPNLNGIDAKSGPCLNDNGNDNGRSRNSTLNGNRNANDGRGSNVRLFKNQNMEVTPDVNTGEKEITAEDYLKVEDDEFDKFENMMTEGYTPRNINDETNNQRDDTSNQQRGNGLTKLPSPLPSPRAQTGHTRIRPGGENRSRRLVKRALTSSPTGYVSPEATPRHTAAANAALDKLGAALGNADESFNPFALDRVLDSPKQDPDSSVDPKVGGRQTETESMANMGQSTGLNTAKVTAKKTGSDETGSKGIGSKDGSKDGTGKDGNGGGAQKSAQQSHFEELAAMMRSMNPKPPVEPPHDVPKGQGFPDLSTAQAKSGAGVPIPKATTAKSAMPKSGGLGQTHRQSGLSQPQGSFSASLTAPQHQRAENQRSAAARGAFSTNPPPKLRKLMPGMHQHNEDDEGDTALGQTIAAPPDVAAKAVVSKNGSAPVPPKRSFETSNLRETNKDFNALPQSKTEPNDLKDVNASAINEAKEEALYPKPGTAAYIRMTKGETKEQQMERLKKTIEYHQQKKKQEEEAKRNSGVQSGQNQPVQQQQNQDSTRDLQQDNTQDRQQVNDDRDGRGKGSGAWANIKSVNPSGWAKANNINNVNVANPINRNKLASSNNIKNAPSSNNINNVSSPPNATNFGTAGPKGCDRQNDVDDKFGKGDDTRGRKGQNSDDRNDQDQPDQDVDMNGKNFRTVDRQSQWDARGNRVGRRGPNNRDDNDHTNERGDNAQPNQDYREPRNNDQRNPTNNDQKPYDQERSDDRVEKTGELRKGQPIRAPQGGRATMTVLPSASPMERGWNQNGDNRDYRWDRDNRDQNTRDQRNRDQNPRDNRDNRERSRDRSRERGTWDEKDNDRAGSRKGWQVDGEKGWEEDGDDRQDENVAPVIDDSQDRWGKNARNTSEQRGISQNRNGKGQDARGQDTRGQDTTPKGGKYNPTGKGKTSDVQAYGKGSANTQGGGANAQTNTQANLQRKATVDQGTNVTPQKESPEKEPGPFENLTEAMVLAKITQFGDAWKNYKLDKLLELFTDDAIYIVNPSTFFRGKFDIGNFWKTHVHDTQSEVKFRPITTDFIFEQKKGSCMVKWEASFKKRISKVSAASHVPQVSYVFISGVWGTIVRFKPVDGKFLVCWWEEFFHHLPGSEHDKEKQGGDENVSAQKAQNVNPPIQNPIQNDSRTSPGGLLPQQAGAQWTAANQQQAIAMNLNTAITNPYATFTNPNPPIKAPITAPVGKGSFEHGKGDPVAGGKGNLPVSGKGNSAAQVNATTMGALKANNARVAMSLSTNRNPSNPVAPNAAVPAGAPQPVNSQQPQEGILPAPPHQQPGVLKPPVAQKKRSVPVIPLDQVNQQENTQEGNMQQGNIQQDNQANPAARIPGKIVNPLKNLQSAKPTLPLPEIRSNLPAKKDASPAEKKEQFIQDILKADEAKNAAAKATKRPPPASQKGGNAAGQNGGQRGQKGGLSTFSSHMNSLTALKKPVSAGQINAQAKPVKSVDAPVASRPTLPVVGKDALVDVDGNMVSKDSDSDMNLSQNSQKTPKEAAEEYWNADVEDMQDAQLEALFREEDASLDREHDTQCSEEYEFEDATEGNHEENQDKDALPGAEFEDIDNLGAEFEDIGHDDFDVSPEDLEGIEFEDAAGDDLGDEFLGAYDNPEEEDDCFQEGAHEGGPDEPQTPPLPESPSKWGQLDETLEQDTAQQMENWQKGAATGAPGTTGTTGAANTSGLQPGSLVATSGTPAVPPSNARQDWNKNRGGHQRSYNPSARQGGRGQRYGGGGAQQVRKGPYKH